MTKSSNKEGVKLKLSRPIEAHGETHDAIVIREPTVKDLRRCGYPVTGKAEIVPDAAAKLISVCAGIPPSSVDSMSPKDFTEAIGVLGGFLGD